MKTLLLLFVLLTFVEFSNGQSITMETLSSAGASFSNTQCKLSSTTGEVISGSYQSANKMITQGYEQSYHSWWIGKVDTKWQNLTNWNGGPIPNKLIDVIILPGQPFNPVIDTIASSRMLLLKPGSNLTIQAGFTLTLSR